MGESKRRRLMAALWVFSLLLVSCVPQINGVSGRSEELTPATASSGTRSTSKPARPAPPKPGAQAWEFTLRDLSGKVWTLGDLRGHKVLINFWASWCIPCRSEIPLLGEVYNEFHNQGFEIVAVNLREDPTRVAQFARDADMQFPVLLDATGEVATAYFVRGIPTSIFLDEEGIVRAVYVGTLTDETLRGYMADLMR